MKKSVVIIFVTIFILLLTYAAWTYYGLKKKTDEEERKALTTNISARENDINTIAKEIEDCKNKYGDFAFCTENNTPVIGIINTCLNYSDITEKANECVGEQYISNSKYQSIKWDENGFALDGVKQLSESLVVSESGDSFTVVCVDSSTPRKNGVVDLKSGKELYTTKLDVDDECRDTVNHGVMCKDLDISPYVKCSESVKKYGPYQTSLIVEDILTKYLEFLKIPKEK